MNQAQFLDSQDVTLAEILDRILDTGVVISGDIVLSVANIELVYCSVRILLSSVDKLRKVKEAQGETLNQ